MTTTDNKAISAPSAIEAAKLDRVNNVSNIEAKLPQYGGANVAVTVTFHQDFETPIFESYQTEKDELKYEVKHIDGKEVKEQIFDRQEKTVNGKKIIVFVPAITGKKVRARARFATGDYRKDERLHHVRFMCSDAKDLRHKIGEAFNEFRGIVETANPFKKNENLHVSLNVAGKVLSTKTLLYGGIKLSKVFKKGLFQRDLFSDQFCRPLFNQLQSVEQGANNKPLEVDDLILSAIGLKKK